MSCQACEDAQQLADVKEVTGLVQATYVRIGNGNVLVSGCVEHLAELIKRLREAHKE